MDSALENFATALKTKSPFFEPDRVEATNRLFLIVYGP